MPGAVIETSVTIPHDGIAADLWVPPEPKGVIIFAHGTGSSRFSSRNRFVAGVLQDASFATLLLDLLTSNEEIIDERTRRLRFDIDLLANRLVQATRWAAEDRNLCSLPVGYFGASTGAAAALIAAARVPTQIFAVVSRGGRPDLAGTVLPLVNAPTLLIVGGDDLPVIELNKEAFSQLTCDKKMEIVPGATHLFEERGALDKVARQATNWFGTHVPMN
jgi:pimeloyl-ACP methyl ester carboxylesterase